MDHDYPSEDDASFTSAISDFHEKPTTSAPFSTKVNGRPSDHKAEQDDETGEQSSPLRFSAEEETSLLNESNTLKSSGNTQFGSGSFSEAIGTYSRALSSCPNYLDYEVAVLQSNIAACHIKLAEWKEAIDSATKSLDSLERLDPLPQKKVKGDGEDLDRTSSTTNGNNDGQVEEVDDDTAERIEALEKSGHTRDEVQKIRIKAFLRRAKARTETGGWGSLQGADEDYKYLTTCANLSPMDRRTIDTELRKLIPRLESAKQEEMAEMMGKLKGLGNSFLKPFGLSTENFQFVQDPKTGGYSMNFNQGKS